MRHNLDLLAEVYLKYKTITIDTLIGAKGRGQRSMAELSPADVCDYACEDADIALRLKPLLELDMKANQVESVFREIEMPLLPVLVDI